MLIYIMCELITQMNVTFNQINSNIVHSIYAVNVKLTKLFILLFCILSINNTRFLCRSKI